MSYAYRIKLDKQSTQVEQTGEWSLSLLELLPPTEMRSLLLEALIDQGWQQDAQKIHIVLQGIRCELDEDELKVVASLHDEVSVEHTVVADSDDSSDLRRARLEQGKKDQERALQRASEGKSRELTARLMELEPLILEHINRASHQVHSAALKIKAGRLGKVISTKEESNDDGELELTIHVKLT